MVYLDDPGSRDAPPDFDEGRYCLDCHYALTGLDSPGKCPECGRFFNFRDMNTFTYESAPPTRWQLIVRSRVLLLVAALGLHALPFFDHSVACAAILFYPLWQFALVWLWFRVTRLDHFTERADVFAAAGAAIGMAALLPTGWTAFLLVGVLSGAVCGGYMYYLKITGWLD